MKKINIWFLVIFLFTLPCFAQNRQIKGSVFDTEGQPVVGANVRWDKTTRGATTDAEGYFELTKRQNDTHLIVSFIGYNNDTISITRDDEPIRIELSNDIALEEVVIRERQLGTISSRNAIVQTQRITDAELLRAACCNLAESFETNPSVDVSYADAATGARQIKLLGLAGTYVQMLTENYPNFRGAATLYGMDYIPGPWMESIQVSKGTSSVKNGYEAIAGQINVEFKKPQIADKFSSNLFVNDAGRYEGNADASWHVSDNVNTGFFVHYSKENSEHDANGDSFLDMPMTEQVNLMNRWWHRVNNYVAQYGIRYLHESRTGGQTMHGMTHTMPEHLNMYHINLHTNRMEGYTKQAYIIDPDKVESVAMILSGSYHEQQSMYDSTAYNVYQKNLYASLLYEKSFTPVHSISTGLSLNYDGFDENLFLDRQRTVFNRSETVTGAYLQYTLNLEEKLIFMAGVRGDYSTMYDFFLTPRIHLKYNPFTWFNLRASAGKGFRTANILAENNFLFASSRKPEIAGNLDQEEAWNTGLNLAFYILLFGKDLTINAEWYYTDFLKQVVVDMDSDPHAVRFYNLDGKSYSNSFQVEATYPFPFLPGFTMTAAYRYMDSKTDYRNASDETRLLQKPLISNRKALVTASYQSPLKKWQFDVTAQINGGGRMPTPDSQFPRWDENFKSFNIWNIQMTKYFRTWSIYIGSENLFNFTQSKPIIDAGNPRGDNFDATMIWGPVHGRKIYAGFRFKVQRL
ncbi:MAG: TonB-dependent receptor [Tannerella sp.]|jgi:outer membrane receptor for ferrienterochelin and colicin|nr:TonB-dependent receptor [Tannerella sp.]